MTITKDSVPIRTLDDWARFAGPKSGAQWVDDRSAKELARAWLGSDQMPPEVLQMLESHADFGPVLEWHAEPEARLHFDGFAGEPRNTDLALDAKDARGAYFMAVEGKADEPFSDELGDVLVEAMERSLQNERSNAGKRADQLIRSFFTAIRPGESSLKRIRYQLLTACAGAICHAEQNGIPRTLVVVHEFITSRTDDERHRRNTQDLDAFLHRLSHQPMSHNAGHILGPFGLPGAPLFHNTTKLYIGKAVRRLR